MAGVNIGDLTPIAMILLVAIIAISIGGTVLQAIRSTQTADNADYNITNAGLNAFITFSDFFTVIVVVAVAAIVIGLVRWFGTSTASTGM